jgi:hypothetical protein
MPKGDETEQLVIQLTDRCNGLCPQCGMRATETFSRSSLMIDDVKRIIDAAAARGFSVLSFTGVPLRNLWISIDSAEASVHEGMWGFPGVIEGIQKAQPMFHERGIYPTANLGINRNMGGRFHGKPTLLSGNGSENSRERFYDYYRTSFTRFFEFVIDLGFTLVNTCYPMSMANIDQSEELRPVYVAESADPLVSFSREEKVLLFEALLDSIPGNAPA